MRTEYKGIKPLFNQALTKGLEKTKSKSLEDKSEMLNPGGNETKVVTQKSDISWWPHCPVTTGHREKTP